MITLGPAQLLSVMAMAWGVGILAGGTTRFESSYSTEVASQIAPFWVWGIVFICYAAVLALTDHWRKSWIVVLFGALPYAFVVVSFWHGALSTQTTLLTGGTIYTAISMMHIGIGSKLLMDCVEEKTWFKHLVAKNPFSK